MQNHITRRRLIAGICAVLVILILGVSGKIPVSALSDAAERQSFVQLTGR